MGGGGGSVDRLSSLPDDVLHLILLRLCSAAAAARTSLLARRWRHLWTQLLELQFELDVNLAAIRVALAAHAAPALRRLEVSTLGDDPDAATATLLLAAPRLTGQLSFCSWPRWDEVEDEAPGRRRAGVVDLPCFEKATEIWLTLGLLGLALPRSGVFAQLTALTISDVRFTGRCNLGAAVSSGRCPLLQDLRVHDSQDLYNLAIHSESLLHIELHNLHGGVEQLTIVAPLLRVLDVRHCFVWRTYTSNSLVWHPPDAAIFAPVLEDLLWVDAYVPTLVQFGRIECLRKLITLPIMVYGLPGCTQHLNSVTLLQRFEVVSTLQLELDYPKIMGCRQYLMEAITMLPAIEIMSLELSTRGHAFGACVFHLLRMSTGIRKLKLALHGGLKAETHCSPGCICNQPQDWKTEDVFLDSLWELEISGLRGSEHEMAFVKRLFRWAATLETFTVHLHRDLTVSDDLCKELLSLASTDTDVKIYFYRDDAKVMYTPVE